MDLQIWQHKSKIQLESLKCWFELSLKFLKLYYLNYSGRTKSIIRLGTYYIKIWRKEALNWQNLRENITNTLKTLIIYLQSKLCQQTLA
jgi:hypothetical protein